MLREGKKRVFDMGKVSGSFQDYIPTGAGDIEQNNQKAVSTARKHQADSLILYIPPLRGGDIIINRYTCIFIFNRLLPPSIAKSF